MADVSHELDSLRYVVDSPLSSKVAMFNNQVSQHKQAQLLNPFTSASGRSSPKPTFSKDQYGKPLAGSLTESRGQKANIHVMREMLELCQIIDSEGYAVNDEPKMRVIPFGELFNIYNYISDKVVGILLRARKYKLVDFEGEMLFQRRDDDVPVFLLKPILEIRQELNMKIDDIKRAASPAPLATTLLMNKGEHAQKLQEQGLAVPKKTSSRSPSPSGKSKANTPATSKAGTPATSKAASPARESIPTIETTAPPPEPNAATPTAEVPQNEGKTAEAEKASTAEQTESQAASSQTNTEIAAPTPEQKQVETLAEAPIVDNNSNNNKSDINNNNTAGAANTELPTIVIEASAVYVPGETTENVATAAGETDVAPVTPNSSEDSAAVV